MWSVKHRGQSYTVHCNGKDKTHVSVCLAESPAALQYYKPAASIRRSGPAEGHASTDLLRCSSKSSAGF